VSGRGLRKWEEAGKVGGDWERVRSKETRRGKKELIDCRRWEVEVSQYEEH
jgi:hypothetical protein